jgi:CubicO group peptidase (beta-lactamase class C family)
VAAYPYENKVEPEAAGIDKSKLDKVVDRFRKQQRSGAFPGGQLVLRWGGKLVLNEACGTARGFRPDEEMQPLEVGPDTPFPVLSAGKPMVAMAIALLEERGLLALEAPIARVCPEFGRHGKDEITTMDVLTHRAGLRMLDLINQPRLWHDREAVLNHLIETKPVYKRGTFAYMAYEFGWILSEVCRRVTGMTLPEYFDREIARPLKLPALKYGLGDRSLDSTAFSYWLGKEKVMVAGINVAARFEKVHNTADFFHAMNPAVSMVTDAANLAAFYEFLVNKGITATGEQLISEKIIEKYTAQRLFGFDRSMKTFLTVGRGFMLGTLFPSPFGWWNTGGCFGHGGGFSTLAFGDYETGISVGIVTNGNRGSMDFAKRFIPLAGGLRRACRRAPLFRRAAR